MSRLSRARNALKEQLRDHGSCGVPSARIARIK
jgi:hypothetical protein